MQPNNDGFLPDDYAVPTSDSKYMKFEQGDNKFRVLEKPIFGWEGWIEEAGKRTPARFRMDQKPTDLRRFDKQRVHHFWAMPVWNFQAKAVQVLQITQNGIQKAIEALARNEDWGSPLGFNITVKREGEKLDTEYFVNPSPHSEVPEDAAVAFARAKKEGFDITRLYEGGDPFSAEAKTE